MPRRVDTSGTGAAGFVFGLLVCVYTLVFSFHEFTRFAKISCYSPLAAGVRF